MKKQRIKNGVYKTKEQITKLSHFFKPKFRVGQVVETKQGKITKITEVVVISPQKHMINEELEKSGSIFIEIGYYINNILDMGSLGGDYITEEDIVKVYVEDKS
jgi:hypothetical protein